MGFRRKNRGVLFLVLSSLFSIRAQDLKDIDLGNIYNKWALSETESYDDILVYGNEDDFLFDDVPYNENSNLKFTSYDDTFYVKYFEWKRPARRCGNGPSYISPSRKSRWEKGVWRIEEDDGYVFLILEHFTADKGKRYELTKRLEFQIFDLTEDRMVLEKIIEQSIH